MKISLEQVSKRYGSTLALDDVTLEVAPGRIVALLGDNGAGKSTLLRMLGAILVPSDGWIEYDGERFGRDRMDLRRRLFFLSDRPAAFPKHTAIQHLSMCLGLYEAHRPGIEDLVLSLLTELDLLPLADVPLKDLSRGQIYKAALAAMITVDADLWLLDEPFAAGMDPRGLAALRRHVQKAVGRGRTVIYSTQLVELAESFADEAIVLERGQVAIHDTIEGLRQRHGCPASEPGQDGVLERIVAGPRK